MDWVWMIEQELQEDPGWGEKEYILLPYVFESEEVARSSWTLSWENVPEEARPEYRLRRMPIIRAPARL